MKIREILFPEPVSFAGRAMRRIAVATLGLLFALFSTVPLNALDELILCFDDGGSVHIEAIADSDCAGGERFLLPSFQAADDCHGCVDVIVSLAGSPELVQRSAQSVSAPFALLGESLSRFAAPVVVPEIKTATLDSKQNDLHLLATVRILT